MEVKFCENNFSFGTEEVMKKVEEHFNDVEVSVEPCLGYCGECATGPYAVVDDEVIEADTPEELFERIKSIVE